MERYFIKHPTSDNNSVHATDFEEAFYHSKLIYSLRHLAFHKDISGEMMAEALQKALQVCYMAGINSKYHLKQIFVFDATTNMLHTDWLMSKKGFNLVMMQLPLRNENLARWLWKLADL